MAGCCKRLGLLVFSSFVGVTTAAANSLNDEAKISSSLEKTSSNQVLGTKRDARVFDIDRSRRLKGWDYVYDLLVNEGVNAEYLEQVLSDPRMPAAQPLFFALNPAESKHLYRKHNTTRARKNALRFYRSHQEYFEAASQAYAVPQSVVLAVLQVETQCGSYTGSERVFPKLMRLAYASTPRNVEENFTAKVRGNRSLRMEAVQARAEWLEKTFLPHAAAALSVAKAKGLDPLELRGSGAGAVGLPQFLPGHYFNYGVDADRNGVVDLYTAPDAIVSVAKYLNAHGWRKANLEPSQQREVIWHYNHSKPYIDTVLTMAGQLQAGIDQINAGELADDEKLTEKAKSAKVRKAKATSPKVRAAANAKKSSQKK